MERQSPSSPSGSSDRTATRRKRLVRSLEFTDDRDGELARDVGIRLSELRVGADELTAALRSLEESQDPIPTPELPTRHRPGPGLGLGRASAGAVRRLRLEIFYDKPTHTARCRATLTADTLPRAVAAAGGDHAAICRVARTVIVLASMVSEIVAVRGAVGPAG